MTRWPLILTLVALALTWSATPAEAGPVFAAIGAIATTVGAAFAAGGFFTTFLGRLLLSVALSALQAALMPKPRAPGIKTKVTQTGGTNPAAFPLLKYATSGTHVCPPMSHGRSGDTPNAFLTYVILLSDVPGCTLSRVMINNEYVTFSGTPHADYGTPATGLLEDRCWIKFYDGSQTVADPMLLDKYAAYPDRPWDADMIGRGCAYAICTFKYKRSVFPGLPRVRFELNSIPLYDPRKDTTVGGSGSHLWADNSTWESSVNPMVATYNVMRGIELEDGSVYGGNFLAEDIPLASAFAAMNECDLLVDDGDGGTEPQFRGGMEVAVDEEPADIIAELMKACSGQVAEIGGQWKFRVGPPGLPVMSLTDADIIISTDQNFRPFPNFAGSYNGAHATYPDPESAWEPKEAQPYYNATYEAEDQGQRLIADLNLVTVPYPAQVRRLMHAWVEEERRFRRHEMTLPPDYALLEPLDAVSWTSDANGYTAKVFEVSGLTEDLMTGHQRLVLRERDSADFSYPGLAPPVPISIGTVVPTPQIVPDFAVTGISIPDASGVDRRPALELTWETDLADITAILWEVRVQATGVVVASGSALDVDAGLAIVSEGILASTDYEVRAKPVVDRDADWTAWLPVTTPATLISGPDIAEGAVSDELVVSYYPAAEDFSAIFSPATFFGPEAADPDRFWIVTLSFEISRVGGSGGQFTVEFIENRFIGATSYPVTLQTFTVMTDGLPDGPPGAPPDGGGFFPRWFSDVRGGGFTKLEYRIRITKTSSPTGKIRNVKMTATRILK